MADAVANSLDHWLRRIRDAEVPIFGRTAERIRELADRDNVPVSELAKVILEDPGMTAKLLRIANSVLFNTTGQHVTTVSRTILLLGFYTVRDVALTVAFVDTFLKGRVRERVLREVARAFHSAVQARWIAQRRQDLLPEEVFIAALLFRLGEMAFWCLAGEAGDQLDQAMRQSDAASAELERRLLGFRLRQLTECLVNDWHISPLLRSVLKGAYSRQSREQGVVLACHLAEALEGGWRSQRALAIMASLARYLQMPEDDVECYVAVNAVQSTRMAEAFGATAASRFIPRQED